MRIGVLVNDIRDLDPGQTTVLLADAAVRRGHEVHVMDVHSLCLRPGGQVGARAHTIGANGLRRQVAAARGLRGTLALLEVTTCDALLIRTNPARDPQNGPAHDAALDLCAVARDAGVLVLNDPDGLRRAASKLYLRHVPEAFRPQTLVSRDPEELTAFLSGLDGRGVLKPLRGTWGRDVFVVEVAGGPNLRQMVDVVTRDGYAMAQAFIPEAGDGDMRVILMDGEILAVGGRSAAVRRVPGGADFRSNVHAGGEPRAATVSDPVRTLVAAIGPRLRADGIFLAGLDVIGTSVVEINVFSPGGVRDAQAFERRDFSGAVVEALERRLAVTPR